MLALFLTILLAALISLKLLPIVSGTTQENNYREYSEADVEQLQEIKKLRLIGIPVQEIKEIYENRLTLQEALSRRLDEIKKKSLSSTRRTSKKTRTRNI